MFVIDIYLIVIWNFLIFDVGDKFVIFDSVIFKKIMDDEKD